MNIDMTWLDRRVPTAERDDWARGGGSWGHTLPAPVADTPSMPVAASAQASPATSGQATSSPSAPSTSSAHDVRPVALSAGMDAARLVSARHQPAAIRLDRLARLARQDPVRSKDAATPVAGVNHITSDWESLFGSLRSRLANIAAASLPSSADAARPGRLQELQVSVLECASLLDELHRTLEHEVDGRRSLEFEASNARAALALLRAQLLGARGLVVPNRPASSTDELTGLADRDSLGERFRQMASGQGRSRPALAMLVLDLDGFAAINQAHGSETGDALLRIVAARLVRALRCDDLVSRLGGDEFACLLANVPNRDMLTHLACKLFDSVAAPIRIGPLQLTVRPSIGIATSPDDGDDAPALVRSARAADRRARQQGSGYAFYDPPMATPSANGAHAAS